MSVVCTNCGSALSVGDRFCSNCGAPVGDPAQAASPDITGTIFSLGTNQADSGPLEPVGVEVVEPGSNVLLIVRGPGAGSRIELTDGQLIAGRAPDAEIFLDDITVSRQHARFELDGQNWVLVDLGSLNGTYVNRQRVDRVVLSNGDEIQIGKYRFHFIAGSMPGEA